MDGGAGGAEHRVSRPLPQLLAQIERRAVLLEERRRLVQVARRLLVPPAPLRPLLADVIVRCSGDRDGQKRRRYAMCEPWCPRSDLRYAWIGRGDVDWIIGRPSWNGIMAMDEQAQRLVDQFIRFDPSRPTPDEAIVLPSAVKVWAVIGDLRTNAGDVGCTASGYDLPEEAVRAVMAYYERHRILIDSRLDRNVSPIDLAATSRP